MVLRFLVRLSSCLICLQHWLNNSLDEKSVRIFLNIWNVSKILFTDIVSVFPWDKIANSKYLLSAYKGPDTAVNDEMGYT